ncbi:MAG: ribose 5-phosphate isomerase A [Candidatus Altiarchaeota archaeon]|nr:ribose 5-phosphate isomerase A [Candidatus Altiarchaeota archaeon]
MNKTSLAKKAAANMAADFVEDGMVVGLGTGSTAELAVKRLGGRVSTGLRIRGVPSSVAIEKLARREGIDVIPYEDFLKENIIYDNIPLEALENPQNFQKNFLKKHTPIDITIDGADRVGPTFDLIKGGGGAHVREKVVANASKLFYVVVDETKMVKNLASSFPVAVEVSGDSVEEVKKKLAKYGDVTLRHREGKVFISDNSNYILDVSLRVGEPIVRLEVDLNSIPGVIDNGLFTLRKPDRVFVGHFDGRVEIVEGTQ